MALVAPMENLENGGDRRAAAVWSPGRRRPGPYARASRPTSFICRTYTRGPVRSTAGRDSCDGSQELPEEADYDDEEADEMEQSIEELLSGPKDSVMMFADRQANSSACVSRLQFDLSSGSAFEDPLDLLLAHALEFGKVEGSAGSSTDQFSQSVGLDSVRELLSGPKDSVMMFAAKDAHCSQSRFNLDMSGQEDPLDVLARELRVRSCADTEVAAPCMDDELQASHTQELALRCRNELSILHKQQQEWASPRRHALHRELDILLDEAAKSEVLESARSATTSEVSELKEKLSLQAQEITSLKVHIDEVEQAKQDAVYARDESHANWEVSALELWGCRQRMAQLEETLSSALDAKTESRARMDEALQTLATQNGVVDVVSSEVQQLRGERDALRALSTAELSNLSETLMESLHRVQRAHQQRLEQRMDEQLCAVCLTERKNVVLRPCNHLTMCASCFDKCSSACPQCRARVEGHLIIYM